MSGTLQSGSTISHYRVISSLGSGGMGEVYMAQDESLERAIALKILPPELTRNEDRVRRFIQEAKSASSLNHPHIVTIYEIGQGAPRDGEGAGEETSAPLHFIAMELITGDTLKHKIHREKTDLRTLLTYLAQAAEGLSKAHSAGIVHRDLKPENIMINRDGYAKVLDFGLAKLIEEKESSDGLSTALTSGPDREQTREGAILGTAGYMSPEQVQGKAVDHRSDIFSFGCILYEAATRRKPFSADSPVETMHKILHDKPTPVEELTPEAPAVLRRVIRRCLAKIPDQRFQSMKDLALELGEIAEEYDELSISSEGSRTPSGGSEAAVGPWKRRGLLLRTGAVAAVVIGLAGAALGIYGLRQRHAPQPGGESPFQSMRMEPLTSSGDVQTAALSPDGKYLANVRREAGNYSLWVRQVVTGSDVQVVPPLPTPFRGATFSPDENYLYYVNQETGGPGYSVLYQVPVLGGSARKILFDVDTAVSFSPDGTRFALVRGYPDKGESALVVANADGSNESKLLVVKAPEAVALIGPSWSPDGKRILVAATDSKKGAVLELATVEVDGAKRSPLGGPRWFGMSGMAWLPDGSGVVVTASEERGGIYQQVWLVSYPAGTARRITNDLNQYEGISITADSRILATTQQNQVLNLWVTSPGDPAGSRQITAASGKDDTITSMEVAPGDRIFFTSVQNNAACVGSMAADGSSRVRLTPSPGRSFGPAVSRDGRFVVFTSVRDDRIPHLWKMDLEGGNPAQISRGPGERLMDVSPDGRWVLYGSVTDASLYRSATEGGTPVKLADTLLGGSQFSPDGKRVVFETFLPGKDRLVRSLAVIPSEGGKPLKTLPFPEGADVRWSPGGDALTYVLDAGGVSNLWRQPLDGSAPKQITDFKSDRIFAYDWSEDGRRIFLSRGSETRDVVLIRDFR
jgi:serine/threonine protein kinase/tricorn protease-like protein